VGKTLAWPFDEASPDELLVHLATPDEQAARFDRDEQDVDALTAALTVLRRRSTSPIESLNAAGVEPAVRAGVRRFATEDPP
jgi:hypothetical protein